MPFDQSDYVVALPQVERPVDPVLAELVRARAKIESPLHWCGSGVGTDDAPCAVFAFKGRPSEHIMKALDLLAEGLPPPLAWRTAVTLRIGDYNDSHTHAEVIALFDRAISARKAQTERSTGEAS